VDDEPTAKKGLPVGRTSSPMPDGEEMDSE
jgi:hypothetical protein